MLVIFEQYKIKAIAIKLYKILVLIICIYFCSGCENNQLISKESYIFSTRIEITVISKNKENQVFQQTNSVSAKQIDVTALAINEIFQEFERLHRVYQINETSSLSEVNLAITRGEKITINQEMSSFIMETQEFCRLSDGLFDPGIGGIIKLWGWHDATSSQQIPNTESLNLLLQSKPSILNIKLDKLNSTTYLLTSTNKNVQIDFGGYLKGVALDHAQQILQKYQINHALINIGGNILALGNRSAYDLTTLTKQKIISVEADILSKLLISIKQKFQEKLVVKWKVGIQHPRNSGVIATLNLEDGEAIGTSGDYQRYFIKDGKRYHHLINPQSGYPINSTSAISVIFSNRKNPGTWSDFSSKPLFLAGDNWRKYADALKISQIFRVKESGEIEASPALKPRLKFY